MSRPVRKSSDTTKIFSERLSDLIDEKKKTGLTQKDIAKELGVASGALSDWCSDNKTASIDAISKLVKYFGVSADWLLGLSDCRTRNETIQNIHHMTGLSEKAVAKLHTIATYDHQMAAQYIDLYSAFIEDLEIFGMLGICPGKILDIKENGLSDDDEKVFENKSEAIDFYRFQMQQAILKFLDRYFERETLENI